jgi:6-phosphogluconate dehydrogenase
MAAAEIGVIGLGVMGANLALNIADNGYHVAVYNRTLRERKSSRQPPAVSRTG